MATKNDITGDALISKINNKAFEDNFDRIFGKKSLCDVCGQNTDKVQTCDNTQCAKFWDESRADDIGQNGNIGYSDEQINS